MSTLSESCRGRVETGRKAEKNAELNIDYYKKEMKKIIKIFTWVFLRIEVTAI